MTSAAMSNDYTNVELDTYQVLAILTMGVVMATIGFIRDRAEHRKVKKANDLLTKYKKCNPIVVEP